MQTEREILEEQYFKQQLEEINELENVTEKELLKQLDELKIKKQKQLEILKLKEKETEFNRQQQFIMDKIRGYLKIDITNEEILSLINECNTNTNSKFLKYYFKVSDDDLLIARKFYNRFAIHHNIRYEDSHDIVLRYFNKIQPLNDYIKYCNDYNVLQREHQQNESKKRYLNTMYKIEPFIDINEYNKKFIPIYYDSTYILPINDNKIKEDNNE